MRSSFSVILSLLAVAWFSSQGQAAETNAAFENKKLTQSQLNAMAESLTVHYQVLDNASQLACSPEINKTEINNGHCFKAQMSYQNGELAIPENVQVYFSHIAPIVSVNSKQVTIEHLNGDLHKLSFVNGLAANGFIEFEIMAPFWHASRSDVMPNHYLAVELNQAETELTPALILSTARSRDAYTGIEHAAHVGNWDDERQYRRRADDNLPLASPQQLFEQYPDWPETDESHTMSRPIPNVFSRQDRGEVIKLTSVQLNLGRAKSETKSETKAETKAALSPALAVLNEAGLAESAQGFLLEVLINTQPNNNLFKPGAYQLSVTKNRIQVKAANEQGAAYGLLTLAQLFNAETQTLPVTQINDEPRFGFRGLHLDVARHFLGKQAIETVLAQMFRLKMNKLHLHLSDDEGWRLAIPSLPELTEIGGFRCHDLQEDHCLLPQLGSGPFKQATGNGFLTVADYQDLIKQAQGYGIEVIPSFDMPGHARAAVKSMQARYRRLMAAGKPEEATRYLLADPNDTTEYLSIQFYKDNTINPCMQSSYRFIETVLSEIKTMHSEVGVPLRTYHLGADETAGAWKQSPICAAQQRDAEHLLPYFVGKVVDIGNRLGLVMAGWSDGMEESLSRFTDSNAKLGDSQVQVNIWDTLYWGAADKVETFNRHGVPVVLSLPDVLYFDFPYRSHPLEPGYYWGSRSVSTHKVFQFMPEQLRRMAGFWSDRLGNPYTNDVKQSGGGQQVGRSIQVIYGMQAQLWTEVTPTPQAMEYMLFPRLFAFAERAWHYPDWQHPQLTDRQLMQKQLNDWHSFAQSLTHWAIPRAVNQGINVRIPPPGAKIADGKLHMKSGLPGLTLQYSEDGINWLPYLAPVNTKGPVFVRAQLRGSGKFSSADKVGQGNS